MNPGEAVTRPLCVCALGWGIGVSALLGAGIDPSGHPEVRSVDERRVEVAFETVRGFVYRVEASDDLTHWRVTGAETPGTGAKVGFALARAEAAQLYLRVVAEPAPGRVLFVDPEGNDGWPGDRPELPFRTLARGVAGLRAGDTLFLRAGIYREVLEVRTEPEPLARRVIRSYPGESVEITGTMAIDPSDWVEEVPGRYSIPWTSPALDLVEDGVRLTVARWPNDPELDPLRPRFSFMDARTTPRLGERIQTVWDLELPGAAGTWTGARIWFTGKERWWARTAAVVDHPSTGSLVIELANDQTELWSGVLPGPGAPFFVGGVLAALDAPGEWLAHGGRLLLHPRSGGRPGALEVRVRRWAVDFSFARKVELQDLTVRHGGVLVHSARDLSLVRLKIESPAAPDEIPQPRERERSGFFPVSNSPLVGVLISGTSRGVVFSGGYITDSWGDGVTLGGVENQVVDSTIENVNARGGMASAISTFGGPHQVMRNRVRRTGRSGIRNAMVGGEISDNLIEHACLINWDGGGIYQYNLVYPESARLRISGNRIRRIQLDNDLGPTTYRYGGSGIYLDGTTSGVNVLRNMIDDVYGFGVHLNGDPSSQRTNARVLVAHNTLRIASPGYNPQPIGGIVQPAGLDREVVFANNLFPSGARFEFPSSTFIGNRSFVPGELEAFGEHGFAPAAGSPAVDGAVPMPGVNDIYRGSGPDAGAVEVGGDPPAYGPRALLPGDLLRPADAP